MPKKLSILLFLYLFHIIVSNQKVSATLTLEDISTQKCFSTQNTQSTENSMVYQISNNSTSGTIFIQYKSLKTMIVSDSIKDESSVIYKDSENLGNYYLQMSSSKNNYYITATKKDEDFQICFISFNQYGNQFKHKSNETNSNIKTASYNIITNSNLTYFISNKDLLQNKIFYTVRFSQKYLDKINLPKMQISVSFINSNRKKEYININNWYLQGEYYYAPFYVPKINYTEKFTNIIFCLDIEFKQDLQKDEMFKFDLDLIDSQEITCEYNIDFVKDTNDKKDKLNYPKVYYINIRKNIYEFDRDILLLKQDKENKYIKPLLTSNLNINNNNSIFIQKDFIDLAQKTLLSNNNSNIDLLILILDETCDEIKEEDNIFISFRFYGGYHDLMHYEEDISIDKFFNEKNNKIMIKMPNCRPQYFFNYFNQNSDSQNDERILDIESSIGHMNLYYMNKISGKNLDEYFDILGQKCIHKFQNSLLTGNFGALKISCDDNNPVMSYIYAHKKNMKEDIINFMNQKSLIYIEYNTQYTLKFNEQEKENEFDFRIKILRTNIQEEDYKIDISYNNQNLNLDQAHNEQFFKHSKGIDSEILIKINSNNNNTNDNSDNTGFILEIFKGIDLAEEKIKYIEKETEQEDLSADNIITFIYSKDEINSANNKIELYNTNNDKNSKIKICIFSGKGKYPYILKPVCKDEDEYLIIKGGEKLDLTYNNPYTDGTYDENQQFYVIIMPDKNIKYSYGYEREIKLNEEQYTNINHNGKKIFKISNQKHNKKSIYYQINVCENKNSNFYYTINNSEKSLIKNDIYQECPLQEFKSFLVEFEGDGEQKAKFKYFYGPDKLLNTIEQFSKDIYLSKNDNNKELLIEFQTPFVQQIDIKIIFASEMVDKYKDFCSFEKFCKDNYDSGKLKIINKKVIANKDKALVSIDKTEFEELLNKDVDIYLIAKSLTNTLEIFYNVKSVNLNLEQLKDEKEENGENKNYLCINCGDKNEQDQKENENDNKENNNEENNDKNDNNEDKKEQKINEVDQPLINKVPINIENNNDNNNNTENKNDEENNNESKDKEDNESKDKEDNESKDKEDNESKDKDNEGLNNARNNDDDNERRQNVPKREENNNRNKKDDNSKNREDEKDGDVGNDIDKDKDNDNNDNNDNDNDNDRDQEDPNNQGNNKNQNNEDINFKENDNNNPLNNSQNINGNEINNQNQIDNGMRNDLNNNKTSNENINNQNEINVGAINKTISNVVIGEKNTTNKKSRKLLYFILVIIIFAVIYCVRNYCNNNDNVNYSKISKYSYYDF